MISNVEKTHKLPTSGLVTVIYNLVVVIHVSSSLSSVIKYRQYSHDRSWLWKLHDSLHKILVINFQRHISLCVSRPFKSIPYHSIWQLSIYCLNYSLVKQVVFLDNLSQNVKNFNSFCCWNLVYSRYMELNPILVSLNLENFIELNPWSIWIYVREFWGLWNYSGYLWSVSNELTGSLQWEKNDYFSVQTEAALNALSLLEARLTQMKEDGISRISVRLMELWVAAHLFLWNSGATGNIMTIWLCILNTIDTEFPDVFYAPVQ